MDKRLAAAITAWALLLAGPASCWAQAFPSKPIRSIVTFTGVGEALCRMVAQKMSENIGQPVTLESQAAAGGAVGAETVMKAPPDGYTILAANPGTHIMRQYLAKNSTFDPIKDFTPITLAWDTIAVVGVTPSLPVHNFAELLDYAKRNPGKLSYGSSGVGSTYHLAGEALKQAAGIDMVHVPYKGAMQALQDLYAGQLEVSMLTLGTALPLQAAGKIRMLGLLQGARYRGAPDLPTVGESVPGFEQPGSWYALIGPAALPQPVVQRLYQALVAGLKTKEVRDWLDKNMHEGGGSTPEQFAAEYRRSFEIYTRAIRLAGLKAE